MVSLDLSFDAQNPRTIAHLIAASGGADVVFDDRAAVDPDITTVVHVVPAASAETESGRQRLRRRSIEWYRTFLWRTTSGCHAAGRGEGARGSHAPRSSAAAAR